MAELSRLLRHRSKREHKLATSKRLHAGIIKVVQRFRFDLGLYVHLHCLVTDGAFEQVDQGTPAFGPLSMLKDDDLVDVLRRYHDKLAKHLDDDDCAVDDSVTSCVQMSLQTRTDAPKPALRGCLNVSAFGMNLLYGAGPSSPELARCKMHIVRYGGVFANAHRLRRSIAPRRVALQLPLFDVLGKPLPALTNRESDPDIAAKLHGARAPPQPPMLRQRTLLP